MTSRGRPTATSTPPWAPTCAGSATTVTSARLKKASALGSDQAVLPLTYRLVYRTTWHDVEFDHARRRVRVPAGLVLDLGAIAKAWCADRCAASDPSRTRRRRSRESGRRHRNGGYRPGRRVGGARAGFAGHRAAARAPSLCYPTDTRSRRRARSARTWQRGASRLHHILDPATRRPAAPIWRTVTAVASNCVDANAATTAAIVRGRAANVGWTVAGWPPALSTMTAACTRSAAGPRRLRHDAAHRSTRRCGTSDARVASSVSCCSHSLSRSASLPVLAARFLDFRGSL